MWPGFVVYPLLPGFLVWLGCRDSNPNYLIQSQAYYRYTTPQSPRFEAKTV